MLFRYAQQQGGYEGVKYEGVGSIGALLELIGGGGWGAVEGDYRVIWIKDIRGTQYVIPQGSWLMCAGNARYDVLSDRELRRSFEVVENPSTGE